MANSEGLAARTAAMTVIEAAIARRAGIDEVLPAAFRGLDDRDRAFARQLAMTALRRRGQIERALASRMQKPPPEAVSALLRIGVAQALYMDVPDHAAVSTTLDLAQANPDARPFKKLMNAVLRGLLRDPPKDDPSLLPPDWLLARWTGAFGREAALGIAAQIAQEPPTDLSLKEPDAALAEALEATELPGGSLRTFRRGDLAAWPGFDEGTWWVQDAAAAIPARLLNLKPGETALDLCAAPGGKTLQMAAAGAEVVAVDRSASRMKRVHENLERTKLRAEVIVTPAETWDDPRVFDAVLLDAPCSATGTFRRQPEVLWHAQPSEIAKLAGVQSRLLDAAAKRVKPGGRLVYCVCSLEPEEGEGQVAAFLRRHPEFAVEPVSPGEGGAPSNGVRSDGALRILPHHMDGGMDGFYAARLKRTA